MGRRCSILIVFVVIILCLGGYSGLSTQARDDAYEESLIRDLWFEVFDVEERSYFMDPPESVDSMNVLFLSMEVGERIRMFAQWDESKRDYMKNRMITLYKDSCNLYIPFFFHQEPRPHNYVQSDTEYVRKTLKGEIDGNSLVFKDKGLFEIARYKMTTFFTSGYRDGGFTHQMNDTVRLYGANWGEYTCRPHYRDAMQTVVSYDFSYTGEDVVYEFKPETMLIRKPNSCLYVGPADSKTEIASDVPPFCGEAHFYELLVGKISEVEPDSLPAPEFRVRKWSITEMCDLGYQVMFHADINVDIVTPDYYLLNPEKLGFRLYYEGEMIVSEKCLGQNNRWNLNPFYSRHSYPYHCEPFTSRREGWFRCERPSLEVEWFYQKEDGTEVVSPRVKSMDMDAPGGVVTVPEDELYRDLNTYDLAGRRVNPENLAPGIYIRNGRKFMVGRN